MKTKDELINILSESLSLIYLPEDKVVELDLGCGKGTFSSELAKRYPSKLILAADVLIGRLRSLSKRNKRENIQNIYLFKGEGRFLLSHCLEDGKISRIHILCPDPWPKNKHKSNRLINSDFIGTLYRKLCPVGVLHFSTDDKEYFSNALEVINSSALFNQKDKAIADILDIKTDFEKKWNELGLQVFHAAWVKRLIVNG